MHAACVAGSDASDPAQCQGQEVDDAIHAQLPFFSACTVNHPNLEQWIVQDLVKVLAHKALTAELQRLQWPKAPRDVRLCLIATHCLPLLEQICLQKAGAIYQQMVLL